MAELGNSTNESTEGRCEILDQAVSTSSGGGESLPISGLSLHQIESQYPDDYAILLEKLYDLDDGIIGKLVQQDWNNAGVLFEHVYPIGEFTNRPGLAAALDTIGNAFKHRRLFGYSFDPKEVHIWHDCPYSNRCCRCTFRNKLPELKTKIGATRRLLSNIGKEWLPFCLYFLFRKRGDQKVWIGGTLEGPFNKCKYKHDPLVNLVVYRLCLYLLDQELRREHLSPRYIEILDGQTERDYGFNRRKRSSPHGGWDNGQHTEGVEQNDGNTGNFHGVKGIKATADTKKWLAIKSAVQQELSESFEFPVQEVANRKRVRLDPILSNPNNSKFLQAALDDYVRDINFKSLRQLYDEFGMKSTHIFDRSRYEIDAYLSFEESIEVLDKLLLHQFNQDVDLIKEFLTDLVDVVDKRVLKKNTLVICSPPSAGKNYFLDTLFNICSNVGYLGTANKTNNFAFQEAPNKRILVWNEVNYESSMEDMVKQLTGGDTCKVRVKNNPDTYVTRTPVICMVNQSIDMMHKECFKERVVSYRWKKAEFLKHINKYPYPLSFFSILEKYFIDF